MAGKSDDRMMIVIPSTKRTYKQITLAHLRRYKMADRACLVVPHDEHKRYVHEHGEKVRIEATPPEIVGISKTREWIMTVLPDMIEARYVFMLDDCYRPDIADPKLKMIETAEKMKEMLDTIENWMRVDGFEHVGLSARQGNNRPFYDAQKVYGLHKYRDATRMMNAYAYDTRFIRDMVRAKKIVLGRLPVMEDFDLTLQLLRLGYPNRVSFEFCWNQRSSGAEGGCSSYRTYEMQADAANRLADFHPGFVKRVTKESKATSESWKGMKQRIDVNVFWRKAFDTSGKKLPS